MCVRIQQFNKIALCSRAVAEPSSILQKKLLLHMIVRQIHILSKIVESFLFFFLLFFITLNAINAFGLIGKKVDFCYHSLHLTTPTHCHSFFFISFAYTLYRTHLLKYFMYNCELCTVVRILWEKIVFIKSSWNKVIVVVIVTDASITIIHLLDCYYVHICMCAVTTTTEKGASQCSCLGNLINTHNSRNIQTKPFPLKVYVCENVIH